MSASRDEKTGKWTVQCYYENWKGEKKNKKKRGFATKKEALEWEREFLKSTSANMEMMLGAFVDVYFQDKAGELKERTIKNKQYMIEAHVLPYFANKRMNEISRYVYASDWKTVSYLFLFFVVARLVLNLKQIRKYLLVRKMRLYYYVEFEIHLKMSALWILQ